MTGLTGQTPQNTFEDLLWLNNSNQGANPAVPVQLNDGAGNLLPLWISQKVMAGSTGAAAIDVRAYGAIPDGRRLTDISATSGSAVITSAGAAAFVNAAAPLGRYESVD